MSALVLGTAAGLLVLGSVAPAFAHPDGRVPTDPPPLRAVARARPAASDVLGLRRAHLTALVALVLVSAVVLPPLGLVVMGVPVARRVAGGRRSRRARARALAIALPEAVDLLLLCSGAGLSLPLALPLVADRAPDPVGAALREAEHAVAAGGGRADALLAQLGALGDPAAALAHLLVDHLRYGVALGPGLERAALELRLARRRRAEEEARRLPVRLLAPLLTCVLPAFVLLTVLPLLVAALRSLPR